MRRFFCCRNNLFCRELPPDLCRMSRQQRIKCETVARCCFLCQSHLTPGYVIVAQTWVITTDALVYLFPHKIHYSCDMGQTMLQGL